jgi:hypothetical protein
MTSLKKSATLIDTKDHKDSFNWRIYTLILVKNDIGT